MKRTKQQGQSTAAQLTGDSDAINLLLYLLGLMTPTEYFEGGCILRRAALHLGALSAADLLKMAQA